MTEESDIARWADAYDRVEAYFAALRIRNKLLLSQLVSRVLERAARRVDDTEVESATSAAILEVETLLTDWFRTVLDRPETPTPELLRRGRLALLLADAPQRWPSAFLAPAPYPEPFLAAMRSAYLEAGPGFQGAPMPASKVDFGPLSSWAESGLEHLRRWPLIRTVLLWSALLGALLWLFLWTR